MKVLIEIIFLIITIQNSIAHEWYSKACCDDQHCKVLNYTPTRMPDGSYQIDGKIIIGKEKVFRSQDNKYHLCSSGYYVFCLYEPELTQ